MKISFFKNENNFNPRISSVWKNAKMVELKNSRIYPIMSFTILIIAVIASLWIIITNHIPKYQMVILGTIVLLRLPLHELCHVFGARLIKKPVAGIRIFPFHYGFTLLKPGAYVKLDFCVLTKTERILFNSFPLFMLSIIPAILAIVFVQNRIPFLCLAFLNLGTSCSDITNILQTLFVPRNAYYFVDVAWLVPTSEEPIIINQVKLNDEHTCIHHQQYSFNHNTLAEINVPEQNSHVEALIEEFRKQFNIFA